MFSTKPLRTKFDIYITENNNVLIIEDEDLLKNETILLEDLEEKKTYILNTKKLKEEFINNNNNRKISKRKISKRNIRNNKNKNSNNNNNNNNNKNDLNILSLTIKKVWSNLISNINYLIAISNKKTFVMTENYKNQLEEINEKQKNELNSNFNKSQKIQQQGEEGMYEIEQNTFRIYKIFDSEKNKFEHNNLLLISFSTDDKKILHYYKTVLTDKYIKNE